jgi:hypothetical protein
MASTVSPSIPDGRQEGTGRARRRAARECPILARSLARPETARACERTATRRRRRCARLLEGAGRGVAEHAGAALLGAHRGPKPALPEGCKVPSRANPCQPGSLGSGVAGQLAASKQTRHVASVPSQEARANAQAVPKGNALAPSCSPDGYHWESSEFGVVESPVYRRRQQPSRIDWDVKRWSPPAF